MPPRRVNVAFAARLCVLGLVLGLTSGQAHAQQGPTLFDISAKEPRYFVPLLTVVETHDDNLFFTPAYGRQSDMVTRLGFGFETGYRTVPFTLESQAQIAGDMFGRNRDLDTARARTFGQIGFEYKPSMPLKFSANTVYVDTLTPSELNTDSGLALGRSRASRLVAFPSVEYRASPYLTVTAGSSLTHDKLDAAFSDTRTASLSLDRRISPRDTVSFGYAHRWFAFKGGERDGADVFTVGWIKDLGERTVLVLRGGPRTGLGALKPELLGFLRHRMHGGFFSITYTKSQTTTLGRRGALDTQSLVGELTVKTAKWLEISSGPGLYRNTLRGKDLMALRLNLEALLHLSRWFHTGLSYSFDVQEPDFGASGHIRRGAFRVRLLLSPQRAAPPELQPTDVPPQPERD